MGQGSIRMDGLEEARPEMPLRFGEQMQAPSDSWRNVCFMEEKRV